MKKLALVLLFSSPIFFTHSFAEISYRSGSAAQQFPKTIKKTEERMRQLDGMIKELKKKGKDAGKYESERDALVRHLQDLKKAKK